MAWQTRLEFIGNLRIAQFVSKIHKLHWKPSLLVVNDQSWRSWFQALVWKAWSHRPQQIHLSECYLKASVWVWPNKTETMQCQYLFNAGDKTTTKFQLIIGLSRRCFWGRKCISSASLFLGKIDVNGLRFFGPEIASPPIKFAQRFCGQTTRDSKRA